MVSYRQQQSALNVAYLRGEIDKAEWEKECAVIRELIEEERAGELEEHESGQAAIPVAGEQAAIPGLRTDAEIPAPAEPSLADEQLERHAAIERALTAEFGPPGTVTRIELPELEEGEAK